MPTPPTPVPGTAVRSAVGWAPALVGLLLGATACSGGDSYPRFDPAQNAPILSGATLAPGDVAARGAAGPDCLFGWVEPRLPSPLTDAAIRVASAGATAGSVTHAAVTAVRLFDGPASGDARRTVRFARVTRGGASVLVEGDDVVVSVVPASVRGCLTG